MVPVMHTRSTGVSSAVEEHAELLSCYEPLVHNEVSPSQYTTVGWGKLHHAEVS